MGTEIEKTSQASWEGNLNQNLSVQPEGPLPQLDSSASEYCFGVAEDIQTFWHGLSAHYQQIGWDRIFSSAALSEKWHQISGGVGSGLSAVIERREARGERWTLPSVSAGRGWDPSFPERASR